MEATTTFFLLGVFWGIIFCEVCCQIKKYYINKRKNNV